MCLSCASTAFGKTIRRVRYAVDPTKILVIDSVDYRKDLTRVYGKLMGRKYAPIKIISISRATDIDGLDFNRWSQLEDNGRLPIEIDFPPLSYKKGFNFVIHTASGNFTCKISK